MDDLTDFEREGFFEVSSLGVFTHVNNNYGEFLNVFYRLNKIAWSFQYEMTVPKPTVDIRRAWCAVLYARTLNFVQAAVILSTKGMRVQADTQHRCALETFFKLGALKNDPQFIVDYDLAEQKDHLRQGRAFVSYLRRKSPKDKALIKRVEASCKAKEYKLIERLKTHRPELFEGRRENEALRRFSVTTEQYARKANRLDMYDLQYRMGSTAVHSDSKSLEDGHFELKEDGTFSAFKNEPFLEDLDMFIHTVCHLVFDAIEFIGQVLECDIPKGELSQIMKALEACHQDAGSVPE